MKLLPGNAMAPENTAQDYVKDHRAPQHPEHREMASSDSQSKTITNTK